MDLNSPRLTFLINANEQRTIERIWGWCAVATACWTDDPYIAYAGREEKKQNEQTRKHTCSSARACHVLVILVVLMISPCWANTTNKRKKGWRVLFRRLTNSLCLIKIEHRVLTYDISCEANVFDVRIPFDMSDMMSPRWLLFKITESKKNKR